MRSNSSGDRWRRGWEVFHRVIEGAPSERTRLLEELCGSDAELRREVEELLVAHESGSPVLDRPPPVEPLPALLAGSTTEGSEYLEVGTVLGDRFEIVRLLGVGGMGEVYEARDLELGSRVAVKLLPPNRAASLSAMARFRHEILLAQKVTHRNVCRVYDLVRDGGRSFLTMELLAGETLAARLERGGRMEIAEARAVLEQVVAGLEAAHAIGVVHRDLKPSNVVLVDEDGGRRVVVTDFGLATTSSTTADELRLTRTGEIVGTLSYMAPEQLEGGDVGPSTDVYALGLMAYEMVTGEPPFSGGSAFSVARRRLEAPAPSPRLVRPQLDRSWEGAILRCLERDPNDRFQHPRELLGALLEPTIDLARTSLVTRRLRWKSGAVWFAAATLVALGAVYWEWRGEQLERANPGPAQGESPASHGVPLTKPMVLVGTFENRTGEDSLEGVLGLALTHEISSSPFVAVAPRARVADALRLMRLSPDTPLDIELARQVALRDGGIVAVVGGELARTGDEIVVRARLVAASDGTELGSWSEPSGLASAEIQAALVRIARGVRHRLGESFEPIAIDADSPQRVTTASWQALRLFDQAEAVIARFGLDATSEELLREAIREDPNFASAHLFLAWALFNQRRPRAEVLAEAERAMALSDGVSEQERFFIRGSYFFLSGDEERARANYEALLRLDPDHYWGNSNLARIVGPTAGIPYMVRKGRARPNDLDANWDAAHALAIVGGRIDDAQLFVDQVVKLASIEIQRLQEYEAVWARLWRAHRLWLAGDLESVRRELDSRAAELARQGGSEAFWTRTLLVHGYRALGLSRSARDLVALPERRWSLPHLRGLEALLAGEAADARAEFGKVDRAGAWEGWNLLEDPVRVAALARSGALDEAREVLESFRSVERYFVPEFEEERSVVEALMTAELDLASGDHEAGAVALEHILGHDWEQYGASYHLAAQGLAFAYRRLGRDDEAVKVLAGAVAKRERSHPLGRELSLATEMDLADLLRELGRIDEAERHERELTRLVRLAEPDFWLRRRLAGRSEG